MYHYLIFMCIINNHSIDYKIIYKYLLLSRENIDALSLPFVL